MINRECPVCNDFNTILSKDSPRLIEFPIIEMSNGDVLQLIDDLSVTVETFYCKDCKSYYTQRVDDVRED